MNSAPTKIARGRSSAMFTPGAYHSPMRAAACHPFNRLSSHFSPSFPLWQKCRLQPLTCTNDRVTAILEGRVQIRSARAGLMTIVDPTATVPVALQLTLGSLIFPTPI